MWPGRRYWLWNVRIWLALAFGVVLLAAFDAGHAPGDIYFLLLWTELWIIASVAVWFVLFAGHVLTGLFRRFASTS